jgi:hypothetical protein
MHHCNRFIHAPVTRREMLSTCANGFGLVALAALFGNSIETVEAATAGLIQKPHYPAKARNVIFLYMDGGPSQMDTFDPKPLLTKEHGQPFKMKMEPTQFDNNGSTFKSPWSFKNYGQCGMPISELFPHIAAFADDLCVVRSMVSEFSEHTAANFFLHTGLGMAGRPSMGAWTTYGLGTENQSLPGFVVLNGGLTPPGGLDNFSNGFLPATYQGSIFRAGANPVADLEPTEKSADLQKNKLDLLRKLDSGCADRFAHSDKIESAIANYELAFRMQAAVPELIEIKKESEATRKLYGLDSDYEPTRIFAAECLIARRLVERGVRFVELTCPRVPNGADRWDQHSSLKTGHEGNSRAVDQPIAALLHDLKYRGLLDQTLVVWAGEFGRTPFAQGSDGRDHNPFGFSIWMAGGGTKGGTIYGATDEYGYKVVENKVTIHDLHATMLHLLGIDHKRLTVRFGGRDMRLTDVHGEIVHELLA